MRVRAATPRWRQTAPPRSRRRRWQFAKGLLRAPLGFPGAETNSRMEARPAQAGRPPSRRRPRPSARKSSGARASFPRPRDCSPPKQSTAGRWSDATARKAGAWPSPSAQTDESGPRRPSDGPPLARMRGGFQHPPEDRGRMAGSLPFYFISPRLQVDMQPKSRNQHRPRDPGCIRDC